MAQVRVKIEREEEEKKKKAEGSRAAPGFEQDMVYCLSDSDDEDEEEEEDDGGDRDDGPVDYGEENDADEDDLIRGDILIKAEPFDGEAEKLGGIVVPRKVERPDKDAVVILDSDEDEPAGEPDGDQSMAAPSTRASSEAPGEDNSADKELPVEVTDDGGYRCTVCQEIFGLRSEIKKHVKKEHPLDAQIYLCQYCPKKFSERTALNLHNRYHTMDFPFSCDECGAKFITKQRLDAHFAKYHDKNSPKYTENRFPCDLCPRIFLTVQARVKHQTGFHGTQTDIRNASIKLPGDTVHFCVPCNESFETNELGQAHVEEKHTPEYTLEKRTKCPDCGKLFRNRTGFRSHMFVNHRTMPHVCDICGSGFQQSGRLRQHRERWHSDQNSEKPLERYKCDHCTRFFMRNQDRMRHEQIIHHIEHPEKLPMVFEGRKNNFPCSKCDRKFTSMRTMRIHFSLKHPEVAVRFKCTHCSKRFKQQEALRDHMSTHTGEHPYPCDYCDDRFTCKEDKDAHVKEFHDPESYASDDEPRKKFTCFYCPRKLLTKTARGQHIRHAHPGKDAIGSILASLPPKSLACPHCPKVCTSRSGLKLHILNHLGKLPYQCDQCDADFHKPSSLENHKKRYHSEGSTLSIASRFKCAYCPRIFVRKSARRYHQTVFHGVKSLHGLPSKTAAGPRRYIKMDPDIRFPCSLCTQVFLSPDQIETHHKAQHPDQEFFYKCPQCPKLFSVRRSFIYHLKVHAGGTYRHHCDECLAQFPNPRALLNHKKRYHGDQARPNAKMFKCTMCTREFARNQDRVRHQVTVHNYSVGTSANPRPGPSKTPTASKSLLKIKQERQDPPTTSEEEPQQQEQQEPQQEQEQPQAPTPTKSKDGFSVASDVEEEEEEEYEMQDDSAVPSGVPTITSVVSIKEETMAAGMVEHEMMF